MTIISLLPECTWILVIAGAGFAMIFQFISRQTAAKVIGCLVLMALLGPFVDALFSSLPGWVSIMLLVAFCISIFNWFFGSLFGCHAASHLWALLFHDLICLPFRLVGRLFQRR
jgi:hypothetical protein